MKALISFRLIGEWKSAWKLWSVKSAAVLAGLLLIQTYTQEFEKQSWAAAYTHTTAFHLITVGLTVLIGLLRIVQQPAVTQLPTDQAVVVPADPAPDPPPPALVPGVPLEPPAPVPVPVALAERKRVELEPYDVMAESRRLDQIIAAFGIPIEQFQPQEVIVMNQVFGSIFQAIPALVAQAEATFTQPGSGADKAAVVLGTVAQALQPGDSAGLQKAKAYMEFAVWALKTLPHLFPAATVKAT